MKMENSGSELAQKCLVKELVKGRDLAMQLQQILRKEPSSSSSESRGRIVHNIITSFERSLGILQSDPMSQQRPPQPTAFGSVDSPHSFASGSPISQDSDGDFQDPALRDDHHKRKQLVRRTQKVQGCSSSGLEGPVEDGYNWRKYGQKDILGAKYPRAYYRCTHKVHGCLATKQVQRSDDDPTIFEVAYRGEHTCTQLPSSSSSVLFNPTDKLEPGETLVYQHSHHQQQTKEIFLNFQTDLKNTKPICPNENNKQPLMSSSSFSFPVSTMVYDNCFADHGGFPTKVDAYQPCLGFPSGNFDDQHQHVVDPQGDHLEERENSPALAPEFLFDQGEYDHDFTFGNPRFYP